MNGNRTRGENREEVEERKRERERERKAQIQSLPRTALISVFLPEGDSSGSFSG
jgi:hypothetical protein